MSDRDSWNDPQSEVPAPAKKRMSGCLLAGLIVGGLGFAGMLVCCGGVAWFGSMFVPTITKEPAEVTAVGRRVLNTEMLEGFSPENAITIDNMIFTLHIAEFKHKEGKGELMIGNMKLKMGDPNQMNAQSRQFRGGFEDKMRDSLDVKNTESHEIMVNGKKVTVSIGEATERSTGKTVHTVNAEFDQPSGQTFFILRMDDDIWDQDAVLKMLEDAKPENAKAQDAKAEEAMPADAEKVEDAKPAEAKQEDVKAEDTKTP